MPDYLPGPDFDFDDFLTNFETYCAGHLAGLGLVAGDITALTASKAAWKTAFANSTGAQDSARAAVTTKNAARATAEVQIRSLTRRLQASPAVDDSERTALRITVPGENASPGGPPTSKPIVKVMCDRLRHELMWTDFGTPTSKKKPAGVLGAELRMALTAIGAPTPTDPGAFAFPALDTATPYTNEFSAGDGGKNAHYIARWVNTAQQHGPWSETVSVTVGV